MYIYIRFSYTHIQMHSLYIYIYFYSYIKESFSGEYHMCQFIPLHSCDYLKKISIKINVATDEGN